MEHELFRSELKPSVDGALVSGMIRSSSLGLHSHRAAAMELILERSIQERRERMLVKAKNSLQPDPTPQPKSDIPTSQVQTSTPVTASQPPSRLSPNGITSIVTSPALASANHEAPQDPSPSKPTKEVKGGREEPPADVETNPSPPKDFVELACRICNIKQPRISLRNGTGCGLCSVGWCMKCVSCEILRIGNIDVCTSCHGRFK